MGFKVEVTNHQNGGNAKAVSASPDIEVTAGTHSPPRCLPGYCVPDTGCQQCEKDGWIGGAPRSCKVVNKKRYERHCDFWARRGHCKDRFRRFMNYWCPKSCQCGSHALLEPSETRVFLDGTYLKATSA